MAPPAADPLDPARSANGRTSRSRSRRQPRLTGAEGRQPGARLRPAAALGSRGVPSGFGLLGEGSHIQTAPPPASVARRGRQPRPASPARPSSTTGYGINISGVMPAPLGGRPRPLPLGVERRRGDRALHRRPERCRRPGRLLRSREGRPAGRSRSRPPISATRLAAARRALDVPLGYVWVDNLNRAGGRPEAHRALLAQPRLVADPAPRPRRRVPLGPALQLDGQSGSAGQLQLGGTFRF